MRVNLSEKVGGTNINYASAGLKKSVFFNTLATNPNSLSKDIFVSTPKVSFAGKIPNIDNSGMFYFQELAKIPFAQLKTKVCPDKFEKTLEYLLQTFGVNIEHSPRLEFGLAVRNGEISKKQLSEKLKLILSFPVETREFDTIEMHHSFMPRTESGEKAGTVRLGIRIPTIFHGEDLKVVSVADDGTKSKKPLIVQFDGCSFFPLRAINGEHIKKQGGGDVQELIDSLNHLYGSKFPDGKIPPDYPMTEVQFSAKPKK